MDTQRDGKLLSARQDARKNKVERGFPDPVADHILRIRTARGRASNQRYKLLSALVPDWYFDILARTHCVRDMAALGTVPWSPALAALWIQ